jgi:hypothetical protein
MQHGDPGLCRGQTAVFNSRKQRLNRLGYLGDPVQPDNRQRAMYLVHMGAAKL